MELARCHQCAALMPDTTEDRRDHVAEHHNTKKRLDAMTRSLQYLNGELEKALARVEELETAPAATRTASDPLTINEFPDDETETGDDTNLADLHDINPQNVEILAAETDDLEARIANLHAIAPGTASV